MKIALLIIDMQKEFYNNDICRRSLDGALEYINEAGRMFRESNMPVVIIQDEEVSEGPGSDGYELITDLVVADTDHRMTKVFSNSFCNTNLAELLKSLSVDFVVVSGFAAEHCVLFSLNGAMEQGFRASLLQSGIAGFDDSVVKQTQLLRPVISLDALSYILDLNK